VSVYLKPMMINHPCEEVILEKIVICVRAKSVSSKNKITLDSRGIHINIFSSFFYFLEKENVNFKLNFVKVSASE
jgi:hypothetical protein